MGDLDEVTGRFRAFARTSAQRAPLYGALGEVVADDPSIAAILLDAPEEQRSPTLLFAAVHHLLLGGAAPALAAHYPNLAVTARPPRGDVGALFRATVHEHEAALRELVAARRTQTNEIGRCALFLPPLALVAREVGEPLVLVDVGTSAGLNQRLAAYRYHYEPGGHVGGPSTVELTCGTRGDVPVPVGIPRIAATIGLDRVPIDVTDPAAVRWLEACVWPDQIDRFQRLHAALQLAAADPPPIRRGDAVTDLASTVAHVAGSGHPVVTNSWVLNYLAPAERRAYVAELDTLGDGADLSWVLAESPAQTEGLPIPTTAEPEQRTVLSLVTWRAGRRTVRRLATTHPHGYWLHWE